MFLLNALLALVCLCCRIALNGLIKQIPPPEVTSEVLLGLNNLHSWKYDFYAQVISLDTIQPTDLQPVD